MFNFFVLFCSGDSLTLLPGLECSGMISAHCILCHLNSGNSPVSVSQVAGITGACYCTWLIFIFLIEMGFHHFGHAGLKLLTSGNLPTLASQSAGITSVSYRAWPDSPFKEGILWMTSLLLTPLAMLWCLSGRKGCLMSVQPDMLHFFWVYCVFLLLYLL